MHPDACTIVSYCPGHVEEVSAIDRVCFVDPWLKRTFIEELNAPCSLNRVALSAGSTAQVIGFCLGRVIIDEYTIHRLAVHPRFRRNGIAARMLHTCMLQAQRYAAATCHIEVRAGNTPARRLYESCGFKTTGMRSAYYDAGAEDAVLMQCDLDPGHDSAPPRKE